MLEIAYILSILAVMLATSRLRSVLQKIFKINLIRVVIIPLTLFISWGYLTVNEIYKSDSVFLMLISEYSSNSIQSLKYEELLAGDKIQSEFSANQNYLGIIGVRFWNFYRLNSDSVEFKIKRKGEPNWFYSNVYKTDQFQPNDFFVFGFPIETNSKGKTYQFEISSINGIPGDAIGLSPIEPTYVAKYKYPRELFFSNYKEKLNFIYSKIINIFQRPKIFAMTFVYGMPLIIYIFLILNLKKYQNIISTQKANTYFAQTLLLAAILLDIFVIKTGDKTILLTFALWIFVNISSAKTRPLAPLLMTSLFILSFVTDRMGGIVMKITSERAMVWAYLFLCYEVFKALFSPKKPI